MKTQTQSDARERAPDISILMTAYNTARFLPEAIESILAQRTVKTWELMLVDDGSSDRTLEIAQEYAVLHPDLIRVLTHLGGGNRGISASRNLALHHAQGELLAFLDSDDVWLQDHLEIQSALLDHLPQAAMVYASAERWVDFTLPYDDAQSRAACWGSNYLPPLLPSGQPEGLLPRGSLLTWFRADESLVPCICTVVIRTAAARAVDGFCDEFRGLYDDQAFHAKVALHYDVFAHDVCTARYRQHDDSCCGRARLDTREYDRERQRFDAFLSGYLAER